MPVSALLVSTKKHGPGQMRGLSMGDASNILDTLTSGEYSSRIAQLDRLELFLKVSIVASCISGVVALGILLRGKG